MSLENMSRDELIDFALECLTEAKENNKLAQKATSYAKEYIDFAKEIREHNTLLLNRVKELTEENAKLKRDIDFLISEIKKYTTF